MDNRAPTQSPPVPGQAFRAIPEDEWDGSPLFSSRMGATMGSAWVALGHDRDMHTEGVCVEVGTGRLRHWSKLIRVRVNAWCPVCHDSV